MARRFSSIDAENLIKTYENMNQRIMNIINYKNTLAQNVIEMARNYGTMETYDFLKTISVDELKTQKHGLPVKKIKDAGYETLADILPLSVKQLEDINGIGFESAYIIRDFLNNYVQNIKNNIKISLSADKRTRGTSEVVRSIDKYLRVQDLSEKTSALFSKISPDIYRNMDDLAIATSNLKWIFTPERKKQAAIDAYDYLQKLLIGEYGQVINTLFQNVESILNESTEEAWSNFEREPIKYANVLEQFVPELVGAADNVFGLPEDLAEAVKNQGFALQGLNCTLRRYQEWGVKYILHQGRVLLGDEMGLGKTVQAIASMVALRNVGETHFLVICPASVIINWVREINKHSDLATYKVHGNHREEEFEKWLIHGGVAVTNYETTQHIELSDAQQYCMAVVDEAHYIKNPEAARTVNVKRLCQNAERILFMTGTALENKVDEMVGLIRILRPDIADAASEVAYMSKAAVFRELIAPVYYRRKREDVLQELPELIEVNAWCKLSGSESVTYRQSLFDRNFSEVRRLSWNVSDIYESSKAKRLVEIVEDAENDGRKVIVFSFFLDTIEAVTKILGDKCVSVINGSVPPDRRQEIIDEFDKAPSGSVLPAQIISGGTGLNIQSASVVVLCEPQFKPSTENQAIARAYRMGQARNVLVYRLLCEDTVDERIMKILADKQAVFDSFADDSVAADRTEEIQIDEAGFNNIIDEEIKRISLKKDDM